MTQGPRDIFHGLSCLLASLSGGQSTTLALLQGKMTAANVPFQQIPRFIELREELVRSPDSVESVKANSPMNLSYELEYHQSISDVLTSESDGCRPEDANQLNHGSWILPQTSFPFVTESGMINEVDFRTLSTPRLGDSATSWSSPMTQV